MLYEEDGLVGGVLEGTVVTRITSASLSGAEGGLGAGVGSDMVSSYIVKAACLGLEPRTIRLKAEYSNQLS